MTPPALPHSYRILPYTIPMRLVGFEHDTSPDDYTLAPSALPCDARFAGFVTRLQQARGRQYLPVCRLADGEFLFALGPQSPDVRLPPWRRLWQRGVQWGRRLRRGGHFSARTAKRYHSGRYDAGEWAAARTAYGGQLHQLAQQGILAVHLSYGRNLWQEHYFPALGAYLEGHRVALTDANYVPFYFVYAALTQMPRALLNCRVLVVNGAEGVKRRRISEALAAQGATAVRWLAISSERSLFDRLDVTPHIGEVDLALVGAGVGKPAVLLQLEPLQVPCIDAGFIFEVWADPSAAQERPYCLP